jgi:cbb3-type cytochrome oxidase subunit 3
VPYSIFLIGSVVAFFAYRNARRRRNAENSYTASAPVPNR